MVEDWKLFLLRSGTRQGCLLSPLLFNTEQEVLMKVVGHTPQQHQKVKKEKKRDIQIEKAKVKLSLLIKNEMILYIGNSKESTQKLVELINGFKKIKNKKINGFSRVVGYMLNTWKSVVSITSHRHSKKEIKKSFGITSIRIKYLGINLIKEIQDLYIENYKTKVKGLTFPNFLVQSYTNPNNLVLVWG